LATAILGLAVAFATWIVRPDLWSALWSRPLAIVLLLAAAGGALAICAGYRIGRDQLAFAGSCTLIVGLQGARAAASFPILVYSTLDPERSISAFAAATRHHSLVIALVWWVIAAPIALLWHVLASRSFRGRLRQDPPVPPT
jgi:cytochrome d ubiquinol oxidase subunit II